jgi:hypothetical protein
MLRGLDSKWVCFFLELNLVSLIEGRMGWTGWRGSDVGNETEGKKKRGQGLLYVASATYMPSLYISNTKMRFSGGLA